MALPETLQEEAIQRYMAAGYPRAQATAHAQSEVQRNIAANREAVRVANNQAIGLNADDSPVRPEFQSLIDPATGLLKKEYQMQVGQLDPSKLEGYQATKKEAMRTGPSAWAQLQLQQQEMERQAQMEKAAVQAGSGAAMARSGIAMRGGLSSGSRERIATSSARDLLNARQGVGRAAASNKLNLMSTDEQNRLGMLKDFTGQETGLQKYNLDMGNKQNEFNISKALEEKRAKDVDTFGKYSEELKKWASGKQATATANSGGGGGK